MSKVITFEGKQYTFPADATDSEVATALSGQSNPIQDKIAKIKAGLATQTQYQSDQEKAANPPQKSDASNLPISLNLLKGAGKQISADALSLISRIAGPGRSIAMPGLLGSINTGTPEQISAASAPANLAEKAGNVVGTGLEYMAPGAAAESLGLGIPKTGKVLLDTLSRSAAEGGSAAGVTALRGGSPSQVATSGLTAGITNAIVSGVQNLLPAAANKVEQIAVKPSKADIENGFKPENVFKYDLGGTLGQTVAKAQDKLNNLTGMLRNALGSNPSANVDLVNIYGKTLADFTNNKQADAALGKIIDHIEFDLNSRGVSLGGGKLNLADANVAKQAVGDLGAWLNGYKDPDSNILEKVADKFYSNLRQEIETAAGQSGPTIKAINKSIGEIIPIKTAVLRRIPVEQRNEIIPLKSVLGLLSGNAGGVALAGANILGRSASGAQGLNVLANLPGLAPIAARGAGAVGGNQ